MHLSHLDQFFDKRKTHPISIKQSGKGEENLLYKHKLNTSTLLHLNLWFQWKNQFRHQFAHHPLPFSVGISKPVRPWCLLLSACLLCQFLCSVPGNWCSPPLLTALFPPIAFSNCSVVYVNDVEKKKRKKKEKKKTLWRRTVRVHSC